MLSKIYTRTSRKRNRLSWRIRQRLINAKRRLLNWRGDGVHSPFAFDYIRQVIRNPYPYEAYRFLYNKSEAKHLKEQYGTSVISDKAILELIFRCVLRQKPADYSIISTCPNNQFLLSYIEATGYRNRLYSNSLAADLTIIESLPDSSIEIPSESKRERQILLLNTADPRVRAWAKQHRQDWQPTLSFEMIALEIWIRRPSTTPGHYPVYYKSVPL